MIGVIDDLTDISPYRNGDPDYCGGEQRMTGIMPRTTDYGKIEDALTFEAADVPLIPMEEWPALIEKQEKAESSPWHLAKRMKLPVLDQDGYGWCHGYAACWAVMWTRAMQGLPYVELSAPSVAGPVTGWRNQGAMIESDLRHIVRAGVSSTEFVPAMPCREGDCKPGWKDNAMLHRVEKWLEGEPGNYQQQGSLLLSGFVLSNGRNFLGHAMVGCRLRDQKNGLKASDPARYEVWDWNSWKESYGQGGCMVLRGRRAWCDEFYVPWVITNSPK